MLIIANGMLRSGSTLQYNLAAKIIETVRPLNRVGFLGDFGKPEVRQKLDALKVGKGWSILKTHELPLEPDFYDDNVRVIFSYRDVRDIAASIKKKWGYPFEQILADIDAMIEIERAFADLPNVLVQSYDNLYDDLPSATREIAQFFSVPLTTTNISQISGSLSVDASKKRIEARLKNPVTRLLGRVVGRLRVDPITQMHDNHISASNGRDGDWVNQFDAAERDELERRYSAWLAQRGYALKQPVRAE